MRTNIGIKYTRTLFTQITDALDHSCHSFNAYECVPNLFLLTWVQDLYYYHFNNFGWHFQSCSSAVMAIESSNKSVVALKIYPPNRSFALVGVRASLLLYSLTLSKCLVK